MKYLFMTLAICFSSKSFATIHIDGKPVKTIACQGIVDYEADQPEKKMPSHVFMLFTLGSREDVKPRPNAFIQKKYDLNEKGQLASYGNSQYYFSKISQTELQFKFIADWKSSGTLKLDSAVSAKGFINSKDYITDLTCAIEY